MIEARAAVEVSAVVVVVVEARVAKLDGNDM